jgi:hypothetical protein
MTPSGRELGQELGGSVEIPLGSRPWRFRLKTRRAAASLHVRLLDEMSLNIADRRELTCNARHSCGIA